MATKQTKATAKKPANVNRRRKGSAKKRKGPKEK